MFNEVSDNNDDSEVDVDENQLLISASSLSICCFKQSKLIIVVHPRSYQNVDMYSRDNSAIQNLSQSQEMTKVLDQVHKSDFDCFLLDLLKVSPNNGNLTSSAYALTQPVTPLSSIPSPQKDSGFCQNPQLLCHQGKLYFYYELSSLGQRYISSMKAAYNAYVAVIQADEDIEFRDWEQQMMKNDYLIRLNKQNELKFFKLRETDPWSTDKTQIHQIFLDFVLGQ